MGAVFALGSINSLAATSPQRPAGVPATATLRPSATPSPTSTPRPTAKAKATPLPTTVFGAEPFGATVTGMVVDVVDGDTIKVDIDGTVYTVRYIGIDTPETVHPTVPVEWMGPEASAANKDLVDGKEVVLEKDVSEVDRYGRLLRYVWLHNGPGWLLVNRELVRLGFANSATYPPDVAYQAIFLEAEAVARNAGAGLWGATLTPIPTSAPLPKSHLLDSSGGQLSPVVSECLHPDGHRRLRLRRRIWQRSELRPRAGPRGGLRRVRS